MPVLAGTQGISHTVRCADRFPGTTVRSSWRKIVISLLALMLLPSSILVAMPLVWCLHADGYGQLEFNHAAGRHAAHQSIGVSGSTQTATGEVSERGDCRDQQVVDRSKVSRHGTEGIIPLDLRICKRISFPTDTAREAVPRFAAVRDAAPPDPLATYIRTTILRI
jgi:hypothetical protein